MKFEYWAILGIALLQGCSSMHSRPADGVDEEKLAQIYATKGTAYLAQGKLKVALADLRKALALDPDNAVAHESIALLYEYLGKAGKAAEHYREAAKLAPDDAKILNNYGRFLCKEGRYDEGLAFLGKAGSDKLYDERWKALVNAGICAQRAGRQKQAETWLRQALALNPESSDALAAMARLMADQGNWLSARAFLQRYEAVGQPSESMLRLGYRIETALGDTSAAQGYLDKLHRLFPDSQPQAD